jgi:hypothetical protein
MNSDSAKFLSYFLPKGGKLDTETARWIARSLHLAFKGMDSGEVYDVLMQQFLVAAARYDPDYAKKIKLVAECIDHELSECKQVRVIDANRHLEFDCDRHLRFLGRKHFLQAVKGKDGKIAAWERTGSWPQASGLKDEPIGFTHFVQSWFRYYLQIWIEKRQSELETKEGVYSYGLRGGKVPKGYRLRAGNIDGVFLREESEEMAQPGGKLAVPKPLAGKLDLQLTWNQVNGLRHRGHAGAESLRRHCNPNFMSSPYALEFSNCRGQSLAAGRFSLIIPALGNPVQLCYNPHTFDQKGTSGLVPAEAMQ